MKQETKQIKDNAMLASLVMNGDISRLTPAQKIAYYQHVCDKLGLDPLSQPFRILKLRGKEILYCHRGGTQQLNKLHQVSHEIKAREIVNGCYVVQAQASTPDGRKTESIGATAIEHLQGDKLCNAMMKAETKAKRRATLDLLGLGITDESEIIHEPPHTQAIDMEDKPYPTSLFLSDKGLLKAVGNCSDEEELLTLYNDNKKRIEAHPELKLLFTEKKNKLRGKEAA